MVPGFLIFFTGTHHETASSPRGRRNIRDGCGGTVRPLLDPARSATVSPGKMKNAKKRIVTVPTINFNNSSATNNRLVIMGGTFTSATYNYTSAHNGNIVLVSAGPTTSTRAVVSGRSRLNTAKARSGSGDRPTTSRSGWA